VEAVVAKLFDGPTPHMSLEPQAFGLLPKFELREPFVLLFLSVVFAPATNDRGCSALSVAIPTFPTPPDTYVIRESHLLCARCTMRH
jgi:hypothetical protein